MMNPVKRVLLINPVVREWAQPNCFPTGLGYIAAVLDWAGHDVRVLDLNAERRSIENGIEELAWEPDAVGVGGIITQYAEVREIACRVREALPVPVVCGGPLASSVPDLLLNRTAVTHCVLGEGEETVRELLSWGEGLTLGLHYKTESAVYWPDVLIHRNPAREPMGAVALGDIPYPAYDMFPMDVYLNNPIAADNRMKWEGGQWTVERRKRKSLNMIGTRGCAFHCIFCYHNFMGQGYRTRNPEDVVGEMRRLSQRYGVEYVHFTDDAFACSPRFVEAFCHAVQSGQVMDSRPWGVTWSCAGRANIITEDLVGMMADAGCEGLCYGLESGSQRMLDAMRKQVTVEQYRRAIALNRKHFKYEDYTFIVGTPGETWDTVRESVKFCKDEGVVPTAVFYMTPYPGTPLFSELVRSSPRFAEMAGDAGAFERFVLSLGEQGDKMAWNCTDRPDAEVEEWHQYFMEETGAWNRKRQCEKG